MGIDEIHFNVSLIVRDKVTRQRPQTTTVTKTETKEPKLNGAEALLPTTPLGQTGSPSRGEFGRQIFGVKPEVPLRLSNYLRQSLMEGCGKARLGVGK